MGKQPKKTPAEIRAELQLKYEAERVFRWTGYADDPKEYPLVSLIESIAPRYLLAPSYLYTIAVGEGLGKMYMNIDRFYTEDGLIDLKRKVNGFLVLGTDDFGSDYPRLKKYLPSDYNEGDEFVKRTRERKYEYGRKEVISADFKDMESGLHGFAAMLRLRRDTFNLDYRKLSYPSPSADEVAYWTYVYYQGEGRAHDYLKANKGFSYRSPATPGMTAVRTKALNRLATWHYIKTAKLFTS